MATTSTSETTIARMFAAQPKLQKMTPGDDPGAFLDTFKRVAEAAQWPQECWATKLTPCLMGEAQAAYRALKSAEVLDFTLVKKAILYHLWVTEETYRLHFRELQLPEGT